MYVHTTKYYVLCRCLDLKAAKSEKFWSTNATILPILSRIASFGFMVSIASSEVDSSF